MLDLGYFTTSYRHSLWTCFDLLYSFYSCTCFFVLTFVTDSQAAYNSCIFAFKEIMIFAGRLPTTSPIINHLLEGCRLNKKILFRNMLCFGNDGQFNLVDELFTKIKNKIESFFCFPQTICKYSRISNFATGSCSVKMNISKYVP